MTQEEVCRFGEKAGDEFCARTNCTDCALIRREPPGRKTRAFAARGVNARAGGEYVTDM